MDVTLQRIKTSTETMNALKSRGENLDELEITFVFKCSILFYPEIRKNVFITSRIVHVIIKHIYKYIACNKFLIKRINYSGTSYWHNTFMI